MIVHYWKHTYKHKFTSLQYSTNRSPWIQHIGPLKKYLSLLGELIFEVHALHDLVLNISQPKTKKKKLITSSSFMTKCIVMCAGCSALSFYMKDFKVGSTESEGWERKNWYRMGSRRQFNYEFTLKELSVCQSADPPPSESLCWQQWKSNASRPTPDL